MEEASGDILAFLTGQEEIESVERLVHDRIRQLPDGSQNLLTVPIYASLPSEQQMNAFKPAPSGFRKVISTVFTLLISVLHHGAEIMILFFFIELFANIMHYANDYTMSCHHKNNYESYYNTDFSILLWVEFFL